MTVSILIRVVNEISARGSGINRLESNVIVELEEKSHANLSDTIIKINKNTTRRKEYLSKQRQQKTKPCAKVIIQLLRVFV